MKSRHHIVASIVLLASAGSVMPLWGADEAGNFFREKVEPIFVQHCYKCHGAQAEKVKGGLLLDTREGLLRGGETGTIVVPGDPDNSKIVIAVRHTDPDLQMPPKEKIPEEQITILEQWVKMGAPDPRAATSSASTAKKELWAAKPIQRPEIPKVKGPQAWARNPIDAFILAGLEKRKLQPARAADKATLLRRASFDLIGLPPTPAEIEDFLKDNTEQAFAQVIDRLLKSPHFGERWGRHWLDLARYADSNGLDQNTVFNNAWRYRDYVVGSFNADRSYRDFIREQLAGDLLPVKDNDDRHRQWIATAFLALGPKNLAEPNRDKLRMDVVDEQIDVTTRTFLGLTVSCARCHDHKFDPIPTRDYYALAGIFRSTEALALEDRRAGPGNILSERPLGTPEQAAAVEAYQNKLSGLERKRDRARKMAQDLPGGIDSKELDGIVLDNLQAELVGDWKLSNYSTNFVDKNYLHDGNDRPGKGKKSVRFKPAIEEEGVYEVRLAYTARLNRATNVPVRVQTAASIKTVFLNQTVEPKYDKAFETLGFFRLAKGTNNTVEVLTEGTKGFVVVDAVQFLPQDVQLAAKYAKKKAAPEAEDGMMMSDVTAARREEYENAVAEFMASAPPRMPMAIAVREGEVKNTRIHIRGDPARLGEEVPRGFLSVIDPGQTGALGTDSSGRLALADWIASEQNPLAARVAVNRIWLHLFGRGLVNTPDNFGAMGEAPSHPELLDYLAAEFMAEGWSTKKMIRRIMLTAVYQLSSAHNATAQIIDPDARYYWRANPRRLEVEALRDAVLAINGTLDPSVGGDSLGGEGAAPNAMGDRRELLSSRRRSLYLPVFRGNLNDLYQVFDFPDPHALAGQRYVTTAPTQALFLMNSPFMLEESRKWAESLARDGKSDSDWIGTAYLRAYGRPCTDAERHRAREFLHDFENALVAVEPDQPARRKKAAEAFCHALLESTEFRFLN